MVTTVSTIGQGVGAGVSQVRSQTRVPEVQLKEQDGPREDVRAAALQLIQRAMSVEGTTGRDLDVLA